ncbi:MAG: TMEM164 family acyltransferase [Solirubrobacteraceae bacterium]
MRQRSPPHTRRAWVQLTWFWALSASLQAVLTPDLGRGEGAADLVSGANYMYLQFRPLHNSLLALTGRWPWYILGGALVGLIMLLVLQWLTDLAAARDRRQASVEIDGLSRA